VKFARQFAIVLLVVAAVVVLGVAWEHSSEANWISPPQDGTRVPSGQMAHAPPPGKFPPGTTVAAPGGGVFRIARSTGAGFDPSDLGNLLRTVEIEAAVIAGVIVLNVAYRRQRRRAKRARM
jgi:hypothetical protein